MKRDCHMTISLQNNGAKSYQVKKVRDAFYGIGEKQGLTNVGPTQRGGDVSYDVALEIADEVELLLGSLPPNISVKFVRVTFDAEVIFPKALPELAEAA